MGFGVAGHGVRRLILLINVVIILATGGQGCRLSQTVPYHPEASPQADELNTLNPILDSVGPDVGPISYDDPAPPLDGDLVLVQAVGPHSVTALITGLPGAAAAGVTQVCAAEKGNTTSTTCIAVAADGSFHSTIAAEAGDILDLWTNGPQYNIPGGPGINSIEEKVEYWARPFPRRANAFLKLAAGLFVAADDGLYFLRAEDLGKDPNTFRPKRFTQANALPSNRITALERDGTDSFWIGTDQGLVYARLSGEELVIEAGVSGILLPRNVIRAILAQGQRRAWVGTTAGLKYVDMSGAEPSVRSIALPNTGVEPSITSLVDAAGALWIGTTKGLFSRDTSTGTYRWFGLRQGLPSESITSLAIDSNYQPLVGTTAGLAYRLPQQYVALEEEPIAIGAEEPTPIQMGSDNFLKITTADGLPSNSITSIGLTGVFWVGTSSGFAELRAVYPTFGNLGGYTVGKSYLRGTPIATLYSSSPSELWISKSDRISRWSMGYEIRTATDFVTRLGLPDNQISALASDGNGGVLVGFGSHGQGLAHLQVLKDETTVIRHDLRDLDSEFLDGPIVEGPYDAPENSVHTIVPGTGGDTWMGTGDGSLYRLDNVPNFSKFTPPYPGSKTFLRLPPENESYLSFLMQVAPVSETEIWFAYAGSLGRMLLVNGAPMYTFYQTVDGLGDSRIWSLTKGKNNDVWIGTQTTLTRARTTANGVEFTNYTTADGLPAGPYQALTVDVSGHIWVGTSSGLAQMTVGDSLPTIAVHHLGEDGASEPVWSLATNDEGDVFGGTNAGLYFLERTANGHVTTRVSTNEGLPDNRVVSLGPTSTGGLFVGTPNGTVLFPSRFLLVR